MINERNFKLTDKIVLLISPEGWGINFVSKHHFSLQLAERGNVVYFLNPPSEKNKVTRVIRNLYIIDYKPRYRGVRFMPFFLASKLIKKEIDLIESIIRCKLDIIWNFDTSRFFNLSLLRSKIRIAHIVDWSEIFQRKSLCKTADICFCTTDFLRTELMKYNRRTYHIGHGYNSSKEILTSDERKMFDDQFKIKAGYIGNPGLKYIDWEIINIIVEEHPAVGFYFLGPTGKSNLGQKVVPNDKLDQLRKFKNVIFTGEVSGSKIPAYLKLLDILLIVYKTDAYQYQVSNPHKVLEYLGSGNVVVSTWLSEYQNKKDIIEMVEHNKLFPQKFKQVLERLDEYNQSAKRDIRKSYALSQSYQSKIDQIEKIINGSKSN
jgi:hypothetical protein